MVIAESGTIVSWLVLTAAAEEALLLPVAASALVAALRAELEAMEAAVVVLLVVALVFEVALVPDELLVERLFGLAVVAAVTVPTTAFVV